MCIRDRYNISFEQSTKTHNKKNPGWLPKQMLARVLYETYENHSFARTKTIYSDADKSMWNLCASTWGGEYKKRWLEFCTKHKKIIVLRALKIFTVTPTSRCESCVHWQRASIPHITAVHDGTTAPTIFFFLTRFWLDFCTQHEKTPSFNADTSRREICVHSQQAHRTNLP